MLYSVKITLAADDTAQAVTDAELAAASPVIPQRKGKAALVIVHSESGNSAVLAMRVGGAQAHRTNSIGIPLEPGFGTTLPAAATGQPYDVRTVYISGKLGDVVNITWLGV